MRTARIIGGLVTVSLLIAGSTAMGVEMDEAIKPLLQAEKNFAVYMDSASIRDGFLEYLAEDAVVFNPGPVNGRELYESREPSPARLLWTPDVAEMDASGSFGWTSGPWQYFPDSTATEPVAGGHYATVWRKDEDGSWRALADIGVSHEIVSLEGITVHHLTGGQADQSKRPNPDGYRRAVVNAERVLSRRSEGRGSRPALLAVLDVDAVILREGYLPARDRGDQSAILEKETGTSSWTPTGIKVAPRGDLALAYGTGTAKREGKVREFAYMRIWRNVAGIWRVALDVRSWIASEGEGGS
ncbi:MAG: nuclear transport factor 2 family protein [bacterium]